MTPDAFIARLASLVPRPRRNTIVYFGVLAANANGRDRIVPRPKDEPRCKRPDSSFAALMKHSFGIDIRRCPRCEGSVKFIVFYWDASSDDVRVSRTDGDR